MKKIKFAFAIHNHQPVGNFEHVFEHAFSRSYLPFLEILERHPRFKIGLHFSGILLEWIKKHHPQAFEKLGALVRKGQVEMLTGGYYEPILAVIPDKDKIGQIEKLTDFLKEQFETEPQGMWLAERIWEPHLPKPISRAGVKYTIVDDSHFKFSGLFDDELLGYYITEEEGHMLALFPSSKFLRYSIPFKEPEETVNYLKKIATEDGRNLIVYGDDGEKFGVWPKTYQHCFGDRWIERFLDEIERNSDWIEMIHLKDVLSLLPPKGRVYLPTASYHEMMQWTLPPGAFREYEEFEGILKDQNLDERFGIFVRGGFWRNFLAKYPEANNMHKKMLQLSQRIEKLEGKKGTSKTKLSKARDLLWQGQCNCSYWHGVFGGLYLPHLRSAVYRNLIEAEKLTDELTHTAKSWVDHQIFDFDRDGNDELVVSSPIFGLYFSLSSGGSLFELDFKPKSANILDTLTRREEGYHKKLLDSQEKREDEGNGPVASIHDLVVTKEEGLEEFLIYDWYRRGSLIDHFLGEGTKLENFAACGYPEQGDFVNQPYRCKIEKAKKGFDITLYRDGFVWIREKKAPITVAKTIGLTPRGSDLTLSYTLINNSPGKVNLWFGIEFGFAVPWQEDAKSFSYVKDHELKTKESAMMGNAARCSEFGIRDGHLKLDINFKLDRQSQLWRFPIHTVSLSEEGFEKVQQSVVLFPNWKLQLEPQDRWEVKILNSFNPLK
ncbi:MAG: alpha-amylase/4-alpha-glucanotransferase domain-containing protein [Candidatus Zixiibacteriota bacterium]